MSDDDDIQTNATASADGGTESQATATSTEPAGGSGKPSDGTDTGAAAEVSTTSAIDELFSELTGEPGDDETADKTTTTTPDDDATQDADPAATQDDDQKTPEKPEQATDQKTKPQEPSRARIKNLEKKRDSHLGAFKVLNDGFEKAGLNPAKALDELGTLAKAKSGDPAARAEIARRYGLAEQAAPKGVDLDKLAALVEDANLDGIAELVTSARNSAKAVTKAPEPAQPDKPAADTQGKPATVDPEVVATGRSHLESIAAGVQAANPAQAPAILTRAAEVMHRLVQERTEEGVTVTPTMWGALFRKAVGRATAEITKAEKPATTQRGGLRPTPAGGGGGKKPDELDEAFDGAFG